MDPGDGLEAYRSLAREAVDQDGAALPALDRALIAAGLAASVVSLSREAFASRCAEAYSAGATPRQLQEVVSVVSGLGVHSLMIASVPIIEEARRAGLEIDDDLGASERALWEARVGGDPFWDEMEREMPGFLRALLKLSPLQFEAFFDFCAVPWTDGVVRARTKELLALASDAMPAHRFMPGFRLHLRNAVKLGAGRLAIDEALDLALAAPAHAGA